MNVVAAPPALWLEDRYSSYHKLIRVTAWIHRFFNYFKSKLHTHTTTHNSNLHLSTKELDLAEVFLLKSSQQRAFYVEVQSFKHSSHTELSRRSKLLPLNPFLGEDGLLHVGGRLANSSGSFNKLKILTLQIYLKRKDGGRGLTNLLHELERTILSKVRYWERSNDSMVNRCWSSTKTPPHTAHAQVSV